MITALLRISFAVPMCIVERVIQMSNPYDSVMMFGKEEDDEALG
ncbi:hypothetical protein SEA_JONJAMES_177 [Gordonia Phage JonJames]|nr:hypothetical protein SEA_JONJAMES_177 [Gordonia Phage JonJames]